MSSDERTVGQQQPPERPAPSNDSEIEAERKRHQERLSSINTEPGDRKTDRVKMLVVEAELACLEGKELGNPAKPRTEDVGEAFKERLDEHDEELVPAWTRPWEGGDE